MSLNFSQIESTIQRTQYSREIYRMTDALMYALNIPHGMALVPFLAPTQARDNRDAIAHWLKSELGAPNLEMARLCIEVLGPRLKSRLTDIQEECA